MKKLKFKSPSRQGFTIIEVILDLPTADLIILMVLIALPALQRNQRDAQRRQDMSRLKDAIERYKVNNRGQLPVFSSVDNNIMEL